MIHVIHTTLSLTLQNLAERTRHAQLGDLAQGRVLVQEALDRLRSDGNENDPHIQLAERTLAKIDNELAAPTKS